MSAQENESPKTVSRLSAEQLADELEKFIERLPKPWWQKTIFYGKEIVKLLREGIIPAPQSLPTPHPSED